MMMGKAVMTASTHSIAYHSFLFAGWRLAIFILTSAAISSEQSAWGR